MRCASPENYVCAYVSALLARRRVVYSVMRIGIIMNGKYAVYMTHCTITRTIIKSNSKSHARQKGNTNTHTRARMLNKSSSSSSTPVCATAQCSCLLCDCVRTTKHVIVITRTHTHTDAHAPGQQHVCILLFERTHAHTAIECVHPPRLAYHRANTAP